MVAAIQAGPTARWSFEPGVGAAGEVKVGGLKPVSGADRSVSKNLPEHTPAMRFDGNGARIVVPDSQDLRFEQGDEITIEAWIRYEGKETNPYIIGKGRLDEKRENRGIRILTDDGLGDLLEQDGLPGTRRRDDQSSLTVADG